MLVTRKAPSPPVAAVATGAVWSSAAYSSIVTPATGSPLVRRLAVPATPVCAPLTWSPSGSLPSMARCSRSGSTLEAATTSENAEVSTVANTVTAASRPMRESSPRENTGRCIIVAVLEMRGTEGPTTPMSSRRASGDPNQGRAPFTATEPTAVSPGARTSSGGSKSNERRCSGSLASGRRCRIVLPVLATSSSK